MSECFAFRFYEPGDDKRKSLVIFSASKVPLDVLAKALKKDVTNNLVPRNVFIMSIGDKFVSLEECNADKSFVDEFTSYVGEVKNHLKCIHADKLGKLYNCDGSLVEEQLSKEILHFGMIALFEKHKGLITSAHGYHFTKPSKDHCDKFIRASNLLVSSIEVSFLAISILPHLRRDLKRIYLDTSSIAFLVSVAIKMFDNFEGDQQPSIESFESYAVLKDRYDFVEDRSSLLVISATTSGALTRELLSLTTFSNDQVVTLFHINLPNGQIGIFDVDSVIPGGIVSRKATECDLCKRGAKLIRITGDQFLIESPNHELLVIKKTDFGKPRQKFFGQFAAMRVLGWNTYVSSRDDSKEHFYIAVDQALSIETKQFSKDLLKNIKRHVSHDLAVVVTHEDAGSQKLRNKVREHLADNSASIKWLTPDTLKEAEVSGAGSVMVIAGAITSGRSLLAISRKLRGIDPSATITYFVAFSKLPNEDSFIQLKKDLCQGGHELVVLNICPVPRVKEHTKTAWDWERENLLTFSNEDPLGGETQVLPDILSSRFSMLNAQSNDADSLFLLNPLGQTLKLRSTFAFWSDLDFDQKILDQSVQADVYWTIACVLHDLRNTSENNGLSTTYHTTLISPANFDRYNDGVIQASLLRSANPVELDYRVDTVFSRQMADVILSVIENWQNAQGEAALEFLMALWTRRLQINDDHLKEIVTLRNDSMPEAMIFLIDQIASSERVGL